MFVDFHSHFFSRPFFEALAKASPQEGSVDAKLDRLSAETGIELPSPDLSEHLGRWMSELDKYGLGHLVTFASLPEEVPAVAEAASLAGGRITPFALVNPVADGAADAIRVLIEERGFRGVLLFPAMHRYDVGGEEARPALEVLDEHGAVAVLHCGLLHVKLRDLLGLPRPYDVTCANPLAVIPPANGFRNVRFVIPHFGAGFLREALMAGSMCDNVYLDTSSSNSWIATQPEKLSLADVFERALGVFGPERILFGTDSSVFPRGWRHDLHTAQREALGACGASDSDLQSIFGGNAQRILGLE
ncbi:MAG: amidohydrolase family protein [Planctomycetota bacterium]|nr:amidohydrolase family protein [Planctomycetota bacterium]